MEQAYQMPAGNSRTEVDKNKENDMCKQVSKKSLLEKSSSSQTQLGMNDKNTHRNVLRTKSSNVLRANSRPAADSKTHHQGLKKEPDANNRVSNANKARKVVKKPLTIFSGPADEDRENVLSYHDSVTLQRGDGMHRETGKTLSRSSSAFDSSFSSASSLGFGFSAFSKPARKIKSQLTLGVENDMAAFFKQSKAQEQKDLGITEENASNANRSLGEITFNEENGDIGLMHKIATERDSPVYQRTHKVSLHALLSSSTESDDIGETTFDYKDRENGENKLIPLDSLMSRSSDTKEKDAKKVDVEYTSHNNNGIYDDNVPDIVVDGVHQSMSKNVLKNLWDNSEPHPEALKFKDPLNLKDTWNVSTENSLQLKAEDMLNDEGLNLDLEFSDIFEEDEVEQKDGESQNGTAGDKELLEIMKFYEKNI